MVSTGNKSPWLKSNEIILVLLLIILLGSFLRIYSLGSESIWLDEAFSIDVSQQSVALIIEKVELHPPLYYIILHFWMLLFGTSEVATRSLSAIFGIISIFLIYQVGRTLFNHRVGLISGFLSGISYFHIYYSQETRNYSLLLLLTLLSFFLFIKILRADKARRLYFPLLFLANICLAYTHIFGLFVIMSQVFYFILLWKKYKQLRIWFFGLQIATLLFFLPWIPTLIGKISAILHGFWIGEPSLMYVVSTIRTYVGSGWGQIPLLVVFFFLCLMGLFPMKRLDGKWSLSKPLSSMKDLSWSISLAQVEEILLLLIWFSFPIVVPYIISRFFTPIYITKYTISASPALYLLAAKGINTFTNKKAIYPILMLIAVLSVPGLQHHYAHDVKPQWRETVDFIEYNSQADDAIIFCADFVQQPFDYYYRGDLERFGIDRDVKDTQTIAAIVDKAVAGKERLWLILAYEGEAFIEDYLIDRFGGNSVVVDEEFVGVKVHLFDLQVECP